MFGCNVYQRVRLGNIRQNERRRRYFFTISRRPYSIYTFQMDADIKPKIPLIFHGRICLRGMALNGVALDLAYVHSTLYTYIDISTGKRIFSRRDFHNSSTVSMWSSTILYRNKLADSRYKPNPFQKNKIPVSTVNRIMRIIQRK